MLDPIGSTRVTLAFSMQLLRHASFQSLALLTDRLKIVKYTMKYCNATKLQVQVVCIEDLVLLSVLDY
jgi:type I site-specific restriction endonuclease